MKILIVDDDATNRKVLRNMLDMVGHEVFEVDNGQLAVEFYLDEKPDLILMDVMMPVLDGYAATKAIKEKAKDNFIPIIFLTALSDEKALPKCVESGGDDFLVKPYNQIVLREKINVFNKISSLNKLNQQREKILIEYCERIERDQSTAEKIYSNLIESNEDDKRILEYLHKPADKFNGDLVLSQKKPCGGYNLLIGDFTGHGLGTAIGSFPAAEIFIGMTAKGFSIIEIINEINRRLRKLLPTNMFLAAVLVDVNAREHSISIWNGGLPNVYVYSQKENKISNVIRSTSLPLGVVDSNSLDISETVLNLKTGDSIIVHSDGVIETDNASGEFFGAERFESLIELSVPKGTFINDVTESVSKFRGNEIQRDDLTVAHFKIDWELLKTANRVELNSRCFKAASSWAFSLEFGHDTLKLKDPVTLALHLITEIQAIESHNSNLFMILSELIVNAIEYGVLGLNSKMDLNSDDYAEYFQQRDNLLENLNKGWIKINIKNKAVKKGGEITIGVSDSGKGFDYKKLTKTMNENSNNGLVLVNKISSSVKYFSENNLLEVIYKWE